MEVAIFEMYFTAHNRKFVRLWLLVDTSKFLICTCKLLYEWNNSRVTPVNKYSCQTLPVWMQLICVLTIASSSNTPICKSSILRCSKTMKHILPKHKHQRDHNYHLSQFNNTDNCVCVLIYKNTIIHKAGKVQELWFTAHLPTSMQEYWMSLHEKMVAVNLLGSARFTESISTFSLFKSIGSQASSAARAAHFLHINTAPQFTPFHPPP